MRYKLPEGWKEVRLEDITDIIGDGLHGTPKYSDDGEYFFINGRNLKRNIIIDSKTKRVDYGEYNKYKKELNSSTILLSINGTIGRIAIYNDEKVILGKSACYINISSGVNKKFIMYKLSSKKFRNYCINYSTGTTIKNLGLNELRSFRFNLPPLKEQEAISNTLSILDDKIENNNKIAKNLEEQAQAIFKHWFVDFEFPNEEGKAYKSSGGKMVESELGMIPEGWDIDKLGDSRLGKLMSSGIDKFKGEKIYLATADVTDTNINNNDTLITVYTRPSRANMQPKPNTIWFAKMKDSRKLIFVEKDDNVLKDEYIFSTGFAGIQGFEKSIYYLWTYIQSNEFDNIKNNLCTGTTMQSINNGNINKIKIIIPNDKVLEKFNEIMRPLYQKITSNRNENQRLVELRDLLLPKLISGEIRVLQDTNGDALYD